ncbi:MAG: PASTA domain-containing protein [Desulfovibrio sp.]|nr:PASTA domain-containing protein [Desulfovibrio sp.]
MRFSKKKVNERKRGAVYVSRKAPEAPKPEKVERPMPEWAKRYDWSRFRIIIGAGLFCVFWMILWGRACYLQVIAAPELAARAQEQHEFTEQVQGRRGIITDRNGQVMARSVEAHSIYASPGKIADKVACANQLAPILGLEPQKLYERLTTQGRHFIWLKRMVDDMTASQVNALNIAGIGEKTEFVRVYPFKHMAGQLLGFVNTDGKGLEGLERSLDNRLASPSVEQVVRRDARGQRISLCEGEYCPVSGEDIRLTLDMHVQYIAEEAVSRAVKEYDARWGGALVVDVKSGDILAWAQYPFFNPNSYKEYGPLIYRNRLAQDALEPGSTFKPLVMALALNDHKVAPDTLINCEGGKWIDKNYTIRDTSSQGTITAAKVLRYSSNIGMAKIGLKIDTKRYYQYLRNLGFGQRTQVPVAESRGILRSPKGWSRIDTISTSFGQSISVTGLQMAQAYLTLLNDGIYKPLRLIDQEIEPEKRDRSFGRETAREVRRMMRDVVEAKDGTGRRARIDGIEVGGKTGTAQKADRRSRTYGSKRLASFVGFLPAAKPEFLVLVMVDEPTRNQFGGVVSAPVFKEIGTRLLAYSGMTNIVATAEAKEEKKEGEKEPEKPAEASHVPLRPLKLAGTTPPWESRTEEIVTRERISKKPQMELPGRLARASHRVPDVKGKSLRNAVELFARGGVVPELKGQGNHVVKQLPAAGSLWPEEKSAGSCVLWLSEK